MAFISGCCTKSMMFRFKNQSKHKQMCCIEHITLGSCIASAKQNANMCIGMQHLHYTSMEMCTLCVHFHHPPSQSKIMKSGWKTPSQCFKQQTKRAQLDKELSEEAAACVTTKGWIYGYGWIILSQQPPTCKNYDEFPCPIVFSESRIYFLGELLLRMFGDMIDLTCVYSFQMGIVCRPTSMDQNFFRGPPKCHPPRLT